MNFIEAKAELQNQPPKVSFKMLALEGVAMLVVANFLVRWITG